MGFITKTIIKVLPVKYSNLVVEYKIQKEAAAWRKLQLILEEHWLKDRNYVPPPHIAKQEMILKYASRFNARIFVETGTYMGYMIDAMKDKFSELYSIELSKYLFDRAVNKFREFPHIHFINGNSGIEIPGLLAKLNQPTLFWLDGHYSGGVTAKADLETPILKELSTILNHPIKENVILIDDARLFNGTNDYPTIDQLQGFLKNYSTDLEMEIEQDIIVITRRSK